MYKKFYNINNIHIIYQLRFNLLHCANYYLAKAGFTYNRILKTRSVRLN